MISVIIPTYNRAGTLQEAARSVLAQTLRDIELIIVDDGSVDDTRAVVESLGDERIRYLKFEKNMGACVARNRGIDIARGEYIAFQDSDDHWRADKLEREMAFLLAEEADVVFCVIDRYALGAMVPTRFPYTDPSALTEKEAMFRDLLKENTVSMVTVLCRRECATQIRFDERLPRRQDWDWALRVASRYKMRFLNQVLVDSYAQEDSISYATQKHVDALKIMSAKYEREIRNDPSLAALWAVKKANAAFAAGLPAQGECFTAFRKTKDVKYLVKGLLCVLGLQKRYLARKKGQ